MKGGGVVFAVMCPTGCPPVARAAWQQYVTRTEDDSARITGAHAFPIVAISFYRYQRMSIVGPSFYGYILDCAHLTLSLVFVAAALEECQCSTWHGRRKRERGNLVFGNEEEVGRTGPQKHLADFDPIPLANKRQLSRWGGLSWFMLTCSRGWPAASPSRFGPSRQAVGR